MQYIEKKEDVSELATFVIVTTRTVFVNVRVRGYVFGFSKLLEQFIILFSAWCIVNLPFCII